MLRYLRPVIAALGAIAGSAFSGGAAEAAPRLRIDPTTFNDDSLAKPLPTLDYDPGILAAEEDRNQAAFTAPAATPDALGTGAQTFALAPSVYEEHFENIVPVERSEKGEFSMTAGDLRSLRVKVPVGAKDADYVPLSALPGVVAKYDEPGQGITLEVPDGLRDPFALQVTKPRDKVDLSKLRTTPNIQLNYRLQASSALSGPGGSRLDGDFVFVASKGFSQFVSSATYGTGRRLVRGETAVRIEDPYRVRTYALGDIVTGAVGFSGAVRLGGLQVLSNFQQRPDIYRGPLPQFAGTAAVPSAVDLYVDSLKVYSSKVPRGPFVLESLPQLSGRSLSVVTTDASGREIRITRPYYYAPGLLRKGLAEYSAEIGFPRLGGNGILGNYLDFVAASGTIRYGLTDQVTLETHAETGDGLLNGGIGLSAALGYFGSLNASFSASDFKGQQGGHLTADYQIGLKGISGFASIVRDLGQYNTLGDVTALKAVTLPAGGFSLARQKQSLDRFGTFFQLPFDPTTIDLSYNRIKQGNTRTRTMSAGFTRRINSRLSVNGQMMLDLERSNAFSARINFNVRLGSFASAVFGGEHNNGVDSYGVSINGFNAGRQNRLGYTLTQRGDDEGNASRSGRLEYRFPQALVSGIVEQSKGDVRGQLSAEGALLLADNRLMAANRIGESFALIKNAGPGAEILQNGRRIARSDRNGNALLPELEAFDETRIGLDPTRLPTDYEAQNGTEFNVLTSRRNGAIIDFGVRKVFAGIVVIVDADGKPYPPGTQVMREGVTEPDIMGYDGEVFLRDLKPTNTVTIDRGEAGLCTGSFTYSEKDSEQPKIGPVTCK